MNKPLTRSQFLEQLPTPVRLITGSNLTLGDCYNRPEYDAKNPDKIILMNQIYLVRSTLREEQLDTGKFPNQVIFTVESAVNNLDCLKKFPDYQPAVFQYQKPGFTPDEWPADCFSGSEEFYQVIVEAAHKALANRWELTDTELTVLDCDLRFIMPEDKVAVFYETEKDDDSILWHVNQIFVEI